MSDHQPCAVSRSRKTRKDKLPEGERLSRKREASRKYAAKMRATDPERGREATRRWRAANRDRARELDQEGYYRNHEKRIAKNRERPASMLRNCKLKQRFGITLGDYEAMLAKQDGKCFICGEPESARTPRGGVASLCVDHDHRSGKVRALLCRKCNAGLGQFEHDRARLCSALAYLEELP